MHVGIIQSAFGLVRESLSSLPGSSLSLESDYLRKTHILKSVLRASYLVEVL